MDPLVDALLAGLIMLGGAGAGILLRRALPQHHLDDRSKDVVRVGSALIATISALVLGLLITSAKGSYDSQRNEVRQIIAKLVLLDNHLARYGAEARVARELERISVESLADRIWGVRALKSKRGAPYRPSPEALLVYAAIEALTPQNEVQRTHKFQALQAITDITEARVLLFEQADTGLPIPLLVVLVFWLTILFVSFTLFSPVNPTVAAALVVIALSASAAIFLILEMNAPFTGLMQMSSAPLREALGVLPP